MLLGGINPGIYTVINLLSPYFSRPVILQCNWYLYLFQFPCTFVLISEISYGNEEEIRSYIWESAMWNEHIQNDTHYKLNMYRKYH